MPRFFFNALGISMSHYQEVQRAGLSKLAAHLDHILL